MKSDFSNIGINRIDGMLRKQDFPFVLFVKKEIGEAQIL